MNSKNIGVYIKLIIVSILFSCFAIVMFLGVDTVLGGPGSYISSQEFIIIFVQIVVFIMAFPFAEIFIDSKLDIPRGLILVLIYSFVGGVIHEKMMLPVLVDPSESASYFVVVFRLTKFLLLFGLVYMFLYIKTNVITIISDILKIFSH